MNRAVPKQISLLVAALRVPLALVTGSANAVTVADRNQPVLQTEGHVNIDRNAPAITRDEILIAAPLSTVWNVQTDISAWPRWNPDVSRAQMTGPLAAGTVFRWSTAGLDDITSTVGEVIPERRVVWSGPAQGISAVHVWTFTPVQDGVLVKTEESWDGAPVRENLEFMQGALDASLESWLASLKREAEARAKIAPRISQKRAGPRET